MKNISFNHFKSFFFAITPIFGCGSLFWRAYTNDIPPEIKGVISISDAFGIFSELLVLAVVSTFMSKIVFLSAYYILTFSGDTMHTYPFDTGKNSIKIHSFRLRKLRRLIKRYRFYIEAVLSVVLFMQYALQKFPWMSLAGFLFVSFLTFVSLRVFLFRVPKGLLALYSVPRGVSRHRVEELKISWAILSALWLSILVGSHLADEKYSQVTCLKTESNVEIGSIILRSSSFLIFAKHAEPEAKNHFAVPIGQIIQISKCNL